jgi:hypothetical protein
MENWFEIFKSGTHVDSKGIKHTYTDADLDIIAANYNPQHDEAPLVIGHPKSNEPAYGWVGGIKRFGSSLFAKAKSIVPEFEQSIKDGLFKKRSIALNPDLSLRHVGFLGAVPPSVKGMQDLAFNEADQSLTIEISEFNDLEEEDIPITEPPIIPDADAIPVEDEEIIPESAGDVPPPENFAAADSTAVLTPEEETNLRLQLSKSYLKQRISEFEIFLMEKLVYGNITVPMKNALLKLVEVVSTVNFSESQLSNTFCFSDGTTDDPLEAVKSLVLEVANLKLTKEFAVKTDNEKVEDASFSEYNVDETSFVLHNKILATAKEKNISYKEALNSLTV